MPMTVDLVVFPHLGQNDFRGYGCPTGIVHEMVMAFPVEEEF